MVNQKFYNIIITIFNNMPVIKHSGQRIAVLIDTQNLYHSAKNLYKKKVNFQSVLDTAVGDRTLIRALSYVVNTESGEETAFFEALEKIGIEIKTKDLQIFYNGSKKADWDVGIAVDAIKLANKVDAIVLATGDGDFVPLATYVKGQGCQVEAITFGRSASAKLRESVDDFIDMDEDPKKFLIGYRTPRATKKTNGKSDLKIQIQKVVGTDTDDL